MVKRKYWKNTVVTYLMGLSYFSTFLNNNINKNMKIISLNDSPDLSVRLYPSALVNTCCSECVAELLTDVGTSDKALDPALTTIPVWLRGQLLQHIHTH